ncbi:aminopeptidase [Proteiniclasticum ruminis]|uniref:M18 family aminopeptidase n=1 Tax=Proteiniclasticum ruminis TaxID=398199 RepID=A0A1I5DIU8_9CLOT|nr:aminopeptidase [Proteiniclasticum ruminis]SFN99118.1 Aspartyl aminopeptidase [Proteiniclasticum ruminis]
MERKNIWLKYDKTEEEALENLSKEYMSYLDGGKTEREVVKVSEEMAREKGYRSLAEVLAEGRTLQAGDKVYATWMKKAIALFHIGTQPMEKGMNILGAHVDSPRLDVKQNPLYEDSDFAYLDTHYYGGIKKYQWVTIPLAIHGVVVKKDGSVVDVVVGEEEKDPVVFISDLLIHLSREQLEKKAAKVIEGDDLNIIIGNKPVKGEEKESVKKAVLNLLSDKYGMIEEDFLSAELEVVPAGKAREAGLDRSMIMAYGHDDRVCAFTSLVAMLEMESVERTACTLLVDKEEIGSVGATGMQSRFFENTVAELLEAMGEYKDLTLRRTLSNSRMLSSDVSAAYDPTYPQAFEKKNSAFLSKGMVFNKFTGSGGKGGSNDANPEYMADLRRILDENNVSFQTAELGKVDVGGGGTIAYILAHYGMEVIDCGVAVLNMHAPWEVVSKADVYETKKGYVAFLQN